MRSGTYLTLLALAAAGLIVLAWWVISRVRLTPAEKERRRRLRVNREGRMTDGTVTEIAGSTIYYSYAVAGVEYASSQDVSALAGFLPDDPAAAIGPVTLKYLPRNPANSILVCEEWSGLRSGRGGGSAANDRSAQVEPLNSM